MENVLQQEPAKRRSFVRRVWGSKWRWVIIAAAAVLAIYGFAKSRSKDEPTYTTASTSPTP
jgi:anti-sigma-K factor RskA